jgi:hypothetical protein
MKKIIICTLIAGFITNCSVENPENTNTDITQTYFTEFMACKAGPDQSQVTMTNMISEWQQLLEGDSLVASWGYAPAVETNSTGDTIWWELQWASQEEANSAWEAWTQNTDASAWEEKYSSVLDCDGENRQSYDVAYPMASNVFGELPDTGYFFAEIHICEYNNGASKEDALGFLSGFNNAVNKGGYEETSYHYGNYFQQGNEDGFLWGNFTNSKDSMDKANEAFEANVRSEMFPIFSEFASCGEVPDLYNGYTLYWSEDKDFMPTFPSS